MYACRANVHVKKSRLILEYLDRTASLKKKITAYYAEIHCQVAFFIEKNIVTFSSTQAMKYFVRGYVLILSISQMFVI